MKIWMMKWNHKMAPRWRHGWVMVGWSDWKGYRLIYDEWLWRYEWWSEITKWRVWRHGWVIRLKRLFNPFLIRAKILWKFQDDCWFRLWDIFNTKFHLLTFDLHLQYQDGVISTWCYDICLPDHTPYAYKIWAQLDPMLLRYKTKGDLTFDLHLHSQDGIIPIPSYYAIWLSRHTSYAYKIWAQLDQRLVRYKIKGDLTFELHLHNQDGRISTWSYLAIWLWSHSICIQKLGSIGQTVAEIENEMRFDLWPWFAWLRWPHINVILLCNMIVWSHSICIQKLSSIGQTVAEIENEMRFDLWPWFA